MKTRVGAIEDAYKTFFKTILKMLYGKEGTDIDHQIDEVWQIDKALAQVCYSK